MQISDFAFKAVWNVEAADAASPGCIGHRDPACLCDVDLDKTKDIDWARGPRDLVGVDTIDDLIYAAAEMLLRQNVSQLISAAADAKCDEGDGRTRVQKDLATALRNDTAAAILDDLVNGSESVTDLRARPEYAQNDVQVLSAALGVRQQKQTPPAVKEAILEWGRQGYSAAEIRDAVWEGWGYDAALGGVMHTLRRAGAPLPKARDLTDEQLVPRIERYLAKGISVSQIAMNMQTKKSRIEHIIATYIDQAAA